MVIQLENIGRRFNQEWIFRHLNFSFHLDSSYAILGPNGSGKSTLIQLLAGVLTPSEGAIKFSHNGVNLDGDSVYQQLCISAPYLEMIEEFTLSESIQFHFRFKRMHPSVTLKEIFDLLQLPGEDHKEIRYFSSGMKQRLKLVLACCSESPMLLLDEPTSNLDVQGITWYHNLIDRFAPGRLLIVGSNQSHEYRYCENQLYIPDFK